MSLRPGYEDLVTAYGQQIADGIIDSAELYSDAGHVEWEAALRWAVDRHENPDPADLVEQQKRNGELYNDLVARRGNAAQPIFHLVQALGGSAFEYPEQLAVAEEVFDDHGAELGEKWQLGQAIKWAREHADRLVD